MGLLDEAIREHLELRRKHGASDDEIARKETDALGPVRREALDSGSSPEEETWLSAEETRIIPSPAADAAPSAPPDESPAVPYGSEGDADPEPPPAEPLVAEPEADATGWFDAAGGGVGRARPTPARGPGGSLPVGSGEPLAPADVFPESDPTVPDERLSADPPVVDAEAPVEDLSVVHGEPLDESDSPVSFLEDEPSAGGEDRLLEDAPALEDEPPAVDEPLPLTTDGPSVEPVAVEDHRPLDASEILDAEEAPPLEDPGPHSDALPVEDEPWLEDWDPSAESLAAPNEPSLEEAPPLEDVGAPSESRTVRAEPPPEDLSAPLETPPAEEEPPLDDRGALLDRLAAEEESPLEDVSVPVESLPLEEERLLADEPPLQEDELFEDEPPLDEVAEPPFDPGGSDWTADDAEETEEPSPPVGGGAAPGAERDDVLEDTPDFLQETPEHDRLWFEQRPPRDFDFDD